MLLPEGITIFVLIRGREIYNQCSLEGKTTDDDLDIDSATRGPINENNTLIWLDAGIDESVSSYCEILKKLRGMIDPVHTFTDSDACIRFLKAV